MKLPHSLIVPSCILLSPFVVAQSQVSTDDESNLEVIEVNSYQSERSLNQISESFAALSQESIEDIKPVHISEALQRLPGTWVSRGNGQEHLTAIRSPVLTGAGGCGAFYMAEDGIALRASGFCNTNQLFSVNSEQAGEIEVLRGPNSVLYGSNAVHGVINVLSPTVSDAKKLSFELGPHEYRRVGYSLGAEVAPDLMVMAYGNLSHDGGYKHDSGFEQQKLNLKVEYEKGNLHLVSLLSFHDLDQETAGFVQGFEAYQDPDLKKINPNPEAYRNSQSLRWYGNLSYQIDELQLVSFTPYYRNNDMDFLQHFLPWQATELNSHESIGAKLKWVGEKGKLDWVLGADWSNTEGFLTEYQDEPFTRTIPQGLHYNYRVDSVEFSPFVDIGYQLTSQLRINGGLRFDDIEYDYHNLLAVSNVCLPGVTACRFTPPASNKSQFSSLSGRIGWVYQTDGDLTWFGNVSNGFRAPQATELFRLQAGQSIADLQEEKSNAVEIGLRGELGDKSMWELAFYRQKKDNFIFQDTNRQNISDGETLHRGVELSGVLHLSERWQLSTAVSWSKHTYENDIAVSRSGSVLGNDIDTAPNLIANAVLTWAPSEHVEMDVEWQSMGEYYLDPANSAEYSGHDLVHLRARWQLSDSLKFHARVLNLLDEDYAERADFAFGNYRYFVGEPRSLFIGFDYQL